jgi:hypothetical protein
LTGKNLIPFHDRRIEPRLYFRYPAQAEPEDPAIIARGTDSPSGFQKGRRIEKSHEKKTLISDRRKVGWTRLPSVPLSENLSTISDTFRIGPCDRARVLATSLIEAVFVTVGSLLTKRLSGFLLIRR